jgi:signal transduction histidine kinase
VSNLVQNALKFTPSGGTITIQGQADSTTTKLIVEDECGGLLSGQAQNLFEPFVQGDRSDVGLGLTIVRRAVEAHGGHVYVQDRPGIGCRFVVEVPIQPPDRSSQRLSQ